MGSFKFSHVNRMVSDVYEMILIEFKLYQVTSGRDVTDVTFNF